MTTLEELKSYCDDPEPIGALMLTGEWGCGKSYFITHDFAEAIKDQCIIVRVSLFGIDSVETLHTAIKSAWLDSLINDLDDNDIKGKIMPWVNKNMDKIFSLIGALGDKGAAAQQVANTIGIKDICPLKPVINDRTVIIIFDDFERTRLDQTDLLGCINDYCENRHFHVIVVANEQEIERTQRSPQKEESKQGDSSPQHIFVDNLYMENSKEEIPYREIKEKAIQRTVAYTPNYEEIIHSIVNSFLLPGESHPDYNLYKSYKALLSEHKIELVNIFEVGVLQSSLGDSELTDNDVEKARMVSPPHNLRSFKCAIHDFFRVYKILQEHQIDDVEKYMYAFVMFVMAYKTGLSLDSKRYGDIFEDATMAQMYPVFYKRIYMLRAARKWVLSGEWDNELLCAELQHILDSKKATAPVDIVRTSLIIDIDESIIQMGFSSVLQLAYDGSLDLNDYVYLIINSCLSRQYDYPLPEEIDWERITGGIQYRFQKMIDENIEDYSRIGIDLDKEEGYIPQEQAAYQLIDNFRKSNRQIFSINRKLYIDKMRECAGEAFAVCSNKRLDVFDEEMAMVTIEAFKQSGNAEKRIFISEFVGMWTGRCSNKYDLRVDESKAGFQKLESLLTEMQQIFQDANLKISEKHTANFSSKVNELVNLLTVPA